MNILVVDDHALFREAIARLLNAEPDFRVVAECGSVDEALAAIDRQTVDVVLLDYDLGEERGSRFVSLAAQRGFRGRVLVVTAGADLRERDVIQMISHGVAGIFLKHHPTATLAEAIRKVANGEVWLEQRFLEALLRAGSPPAEDSGPARLTAREMQVLRGVLEGLANKQIGDRLEVSESSVKAALQQLFHKTGVRTRSQLVRIALERYQDQL